jgi:hypothetical protein
MGKRMPAAFFISSGVAVPRAIFAARREGGIDVGGDIHG